MKHDGMWRVSFLWDKKTTVDGEGIGGGLCVSILFSSSDSHMMQYQRGRRRKLMRKMLPEQVSVCPVICSPVLERKVCRQLLLELNNMRKTDCEQV